MKMRRKDSPHRERHILPRTTAIVIGATIIVALIIICSVKAGGGKAIPYPVPKGCPRLPQITIDTAGLERMMEIARIDCYLRSKGSPLAGTGKTWVECSERYGIPWSLAIGICGHESYFGKLCFRPYNAGGLMAYSGFRGWEEYIDAQFAWLSRHYGHPTDPAQCRGYCEGTPASWVNGVRGIMREAEQ